MFIRSWKVSTKNTPSFLVLMLWMLSFLGPVVFGQTSEDPEQNLRMLMELEQEEVPAGSSVQKFFGSFDVETEQVYENVLQGGTFTVPVKELSKILDEKKLKQAFHDARFSFAEEDKSKTSSSNTAGASNMKRINAAPRDSYPSHDDVNVAILDTGIDTDHPDLADNIAGGTSVVGSSLEDHSGHGTHVAGIIAAQDNGTGLTGVAPEANLYPVKIGKKSEGSVGNLISGLDWVMDKTKHEPIQVINMSLVKRTLPGKDLLKKAIKNTVQEDVLVVTSAGNDREKVTEFAPSRYKEVITVSALKNGKNQLSSSSNYGRKIELTAPGTNILSTEPGGYGIRTGTSVSAAHVTGVASLMVGSIEEMWSPRKFETKLTRGGIQRNWTNDPDEKHEPLINAELQPHVLTFASGFGPVDENDSNKTQENVTIRKRLWGKNSDRDREHSDFWHIELYVKPRFPHKCDLKTTFRLNSGGNKIKVKNNPQTDTPADLPKEWDSRRGSVPIKGQKFYIEGENTSDSYSDVELEVKRVHYGERGWCYGRDHPRKHSTKYQFTIIEQETKTIETTESNKEHRREFPVVDQKPIVVTEGDDIRIEKKIKKPNLGDPFLFFAGVNPSERGTFKEEKVEGKKTFESTFQPSSRNISKEPEITQVGFRYDPDKRIFGRMDLCIIEQDLVRLLYGEIRGINREDIERIGWAWLVRNRTEEEDELPRDFGDNIQEVARSGEFGGWNRNKELVRKDLSGDEHEFDRKMYDRITSKIIPKVLEGCTGGFVEDPTDGALFGISVSDTGAKNLLKAFDNDRTISARKLDLPNTIDPDTGNNILTDEVEWQAVLLNKRSEFEDVDDINPPSVFFRVKNGNEPTVRFNIKQDDIQ